MENDLIRRSDAENIFRMARRAMKPENYSGQEFFIRDNILLNAEQIVHSIPAVDAVPWEFLERYADWFCAVVSMPEFVREAKAFYYDTYKAMEGGNIGD